MNGIVVISLCAVVLAAAQARQMPAEISKFLGFGGSEDGPRTLEKEVKLFLGGKFDAIDTARKNLGLGAVEQYMPAPIETVECHVEFQVTKRVPGRCTKLAGRFPACQAEQYIGINYSECA